MPKFGSKSREELSTLRQPLQLVCLDAIEIMDFSILCGHRGKEAQNKAFEGGNSKAKWGESKHNSYPSNAVDIAPWPIDWDNKERFAELAGVMKACAFKRGIKIKWGGNFKSFFDGPHYELIDKQV